MLLIILHRVDRTLNGLALYFNRRVFIKKGLIFFWFLFFNFPKQYLYDMKIDRKKIEALKVQARMVLSRKYLVAGILFVVWILFFDENSIVAHQRQQQRLDEMLKQKDHYIEQIAADKVKLDELNSGLSNLEKFAREQYYLSAPGEDVFIVAED